MKLEVGKVYKFTHKTQILGNGEPTYFIAKINVEPDHDGDYHVFTMESTRPAYIEGSYSYFNERNNNYNIEEYHVLDNIDGIQRRKGRQPRLISTQVDELAVAETIVMNNTLYDMYVNMAIDTDDKEWLIELGNWKKSQKGVNV